MQGLSFLEVQCESYKILYDFLQTWNFPQTSVDYNSSVLHRKGPISRFDAAAALDRRDGRQIAVGLPFTR